MMKSSLLQTCARTLRPLLPLAALAALTNTPSQGALIASSNFNSAGSADSLPAVTWTPMVVRGTGATASSYAAISAVGTVDVTTNTGSTSAPPAGTRTNALKMNIDFTGATGGSWSGGMQTPILTVSNGVTTLNQLNLSFDLLAVESLPVRVRIESFDASNNRTGALEGEVIPPVAGSFYHFSVDLNTLVGVSGVAAFAPASQGVRFSFYVDGGSGVTAGWPNASNNIVQVDNICYNSPSLWVSNITSANTGADSGHPTTLTDAFSRVQPGDVICLLGGTYTTVPTITFAGKPARWITLRAAPGQTPVINTSQRTSLGAIGGCAYLDLRSLTFQGIYNDTNATAAGTQIYNAQQDGMILNTSSDPKNPSATIYSGTGFNVYYGLDTNETSGINLNGRTANSQGVEGIHHVRIADNIVKDMPALGIGGNQCDYLYVENNTVTECAHLSRSAVSGMSFVIPQNFDGNTDTKIFVVRNTCGRNRGDVRWVHNYTNSGGYQVVDIAYSDGNGIIIDINRNFETNSSSTLAAYVGRTLVQNNVCYLNGGSGAHAFGAAHVDIVNNTLYNNDQPNKASGNIYRMTYTANSIITPTNLHPSYTLVQASTSSAGTALGYGEVFAGSNTKDVHIFNNVAYAPAGGPVNAASPGAGTDVSYDYNVFGQLNGGAGSGVASTANFSSYTGNLANGYPAPTDIFASVTEGQANFLHLTSTSPAVNHASNGGSLFYPTDDRDEGAMRPQGGAADDGAYEDF